MSNELLEKVISTSQIGAGGGGLLSPEQANTFINYMWDQTVLGDLVRTIRMRSDTMEIDRINVGQRIARVATEAVDDHVNANATFSKISLTTRKIRLDWELSTEGLEDNLEGADLEDTIARLMAQALGNDLEDVAINGDAASVDPLLKAFNGWRKLALAGGAIVDAAGAGVTRTLYNRMLKALPRKYKQRRNELRFFQGSNLVQDYLTHLADTVSDFTPAIVRGDINAPNGAPGTVYTLAYGIPVVEVPYFPETLAGTYASPTGNHGEILLTFPRNLLWGVKREITVYREFKPKKDTIEYTVYTRVGTAVENLEAVVVATNVKISAT